MFKLINVNNVINYNKDNDNYEYNDLYYLMDDSDKNYVIGYGVIKYDDNINDSANISCGIRKKDRNKGYGNLLLKLLLDECRDRNMSNAYVTCLYEDLYSNKVVINNDGISTKGFMDNNGKYNVKYEIKLKNKIRKL